MNPVPHLTADEAAALLGMSARQFRFYTETLGFIQPMDTPLGPRYREDELLEFRDATRPGGPPVTKLKIGEAARILGVTTRTLRQAAEGDEPLLHRDKRGMFDYAEVHAFKSKRGGRKGLRDPVPFPAKGT